MTMRERDYLLAAAIHSLGYSTRFLKGENKECEKGEKIPSAFLSDFNAKKRESVNHKIGSYRLRKNSLLSTRLYLFVCLFF